MFDWDKSLPWSRKKVNWISETATFLINIYVITFLSLSITIKLFILGEAMEDDDYDEEEDDDDDQDDDDDEEDDEEYFPKLSNSQFNKNANPADCKQQ